MLFWISQDFLPHFPLQLIPLFHDFSCTHLSPAVDSEFHKGNVYIYLFIFKFAFLMPGSGLDSYGFHKRQLKEWTRGSSGHSGSK